jgi:hypothetical protein
MKLGKLLKLAVKICSRRRFSRSCILLLSLRIGCALLVSFIVPLLGSRILLCIFLVLVVVYCTGGAGDNRRPNRYSSYTSSSHYSSGSHIDLLINFLMMVSNLTGQVLDL